MHKSKNIVHINTKAKRSQTSCLQEVWPFYSLTSVKDGIIRSYFKTNRVAFLGIFQFHYPLALFYRHFFQTNSYIFFDLFLHIEIKLSAGWRFYADLNITPGAMPFLLERNHRTAGWRFFRFMGKRWCYVFRCCRRCLRRQAGRTDCRLNRR